LLVCDMRKNPPVQTHNATERNDLNAKLGCVVNYIVGMYKLLTN